MATVTFGDTTLWNDGSSPPTGDGPVQFAAPTLENYDMSRPMPRGTGNVLKAGGRGAVTFVVGMLKRHANRAAEASFAATLDGLKDTQPVTLKTVTVTDRGSVPNCRLVSWQAQPSAPVLINGASTPVFHQYYYLIFERMF